VAVIIFVGSSSTKNESTWDKEFFKESESQKNLFEITMERLATLGDSYGFPTTYIYYDKDHSERVNKFIKGYRYGDKLHCCLQSMHPVLNLNGNVCLRAGDSPDILQMPNGSGDFHHASIKGMGILEKLQGEKIEYVCCCNCENMLEMVIDPYLVGLFDVNKNDYDLMYKCTYPENQNDRTFKRVVWQNGIPKADTIPNLSTIENNYNKQSTINLQVVQDSPVWMGSLIFHVEKVIGVLKSAGGISYFPQAVNYKIKQMTYWSPSDAGFRKDEACYVFDKDLSDLFINNLFKSKGIMVDREEEYLPVLTERDEYSWRTAYKDLLHKTEKLKVPFYDRIQPPVMLESMIRNDEYERNRPN
jgi:hypothetical protein